MDFKVFIKNEFTIYDHSCLSLSHLNAQCCIHNINTLDIESHKYISEQISNNEDHLQSSKVESYKMNTDCKCVLRGNGRIGSRVGRQVSVKLEGHAAAPSASPVQSPVACDAVWDFALCVR